MTEGGRCALIRSTARRLDVVIIVVAESGRAEAIRTALDTLAPLAECKHVPRALFGISSIDREEKCGDYK